MSIIQILFSIFTGREAGFNEADDYDLPDVKVK